MTGPAGYRAARESAALFHLSSREVVRLRGADRADFLNRMCTNEVNALPVGAGVWIALLTAKGRIVADARALKREGEILLDVDPGYGARVAEFLAQFVIADDVEVERGEDQWTSWLVVGPKSGEVLARALGETPPALAHLTFVERTFQGAPLIVVRDERLGEDGFWIWVSRQAGPELGAALETAGAVRASAEALESLRIEAGVPRPGVDYNDETLVLEAGLDRALSFKKGCYIGQEVVARATYRGRLNKKLMGLVLDGPVPPAGEKLFHDGKEAGWITSAAAAPMLGATGALGYARRELFGGGEVLLADGRRARVVKLPLHRGPRTWPDLPPVCE